MKNSYSAVITLTVAAALSAARPQSVSAGEFITFGSYPQTEVTSPSSDITGASYDRNGDAVVGGQRYRRVEDIEYGYTLEEDLTDDDGSPVYDMIPYVEQDNGYRYFKYEPIQWEKIQLDGEEYLLAKDALDAQPYDRQPRRQVYGLGRYIDSARHSNWDECSLRPWLNDDFISTAFTDDEQSRLQTTASGDRVSLLSSAEVKELSRLANPPRLSKTASDYAALKGSNSKGLQVNEGSFFDGGCEWILRDILTMYNSKGEATEFLSPRHVKATGELCAGQEILIPYESAIVPLIKASDVGTPSYAGNDETVIVYRPWGEAKRISKNEFDAYMNNGWFQSPGAAKNFTADHMNNKFKASEAYASYSGCVKSWATTADPEITIVYNQKDDPSFQDIASFVDGLMEGTLTGKMEDYMRFDIKLPGNHLHGDEQDALQAMYTEWGRMVNSPNASYFRIDVNGVGSFNYDDTDYFYKINEIASQARQYSSDQERQLGYLKTWLAQNAYYDGNQFGNDPITLILDGKGVCGNYANAVKDICVLLDIPCMVISNKNANHAWNCLYVNNNWYELDFTGVSQPYTDGEQILFPVSYGTHSGDVISPEWLDYMKELYKDNTTASVGQTQQIENTMYGAPAIRVNVNGQDVPFAHPPVLNAGRVYAAYDDIARAYGAAVTVEDDWVTMSKDGVRVMFSLNTDAGSAYFARSSFFKRDLTFSDMPYWADGAFYVPLANIINGFNIFAEVSWNPDEGCVYIKD